MIMCASCCLHSVVRLGPVGEVTGDSRGDMLKSLLGKCYFKYRCKYTKQLCTGSSIMKIFLLNKRKPKSALRVLACTNVSKWCSPALILISKGGGGGVDRADNACHETILRKTKDCCW